MRQASQEACAVAQLDTGLTDAPGLDLAGHAGYVEQLQRPGLDRQRARGAGRRLRLFDHPAAHSAPGQLQRQRHPGRTGSRDQDHGVHAPPSQQFDTTTCIGLR